GTADFGGVIAKAYTRGGMLLEASIGGQKFNFHPKQNGANKAQQATTPNASAPQTANVTPASAKAASPQATGAPAKPPAAPPKAASPQATAAPAKPPADPAKAASPQATAAPAKPRLAPVKDVPREATAASAKKDQPNPIEGSAQVPKTRGPLARGAL